MKQFRDNDTSDISQSHIEMMVQVQCGQGSRLPPVRIFFMFINESPSDRWILIGKHTKNIEMTWDMDTYRTSRGQYNNVKR